MPSEHVLIVDDNPTNLKLLRIILEQEGYDVATANDAEEALRRLAHAKPRMILMDIQLPGIDGLELTRRLKADPRYTGTVIIALTAYAMKGDEEKARAAGCDGYITKPIDAEQLPRTLAAYLAGRSPAVELKG
jgi:CheY-like chemotaxis protein